MPMPGKVGSSKSSSGPTRYTDSGSEQRARSSSSSYSSSRSSYGSSGSRSSSSSSNYSSSRSSYGSSGSRSSYSSSPSRYTDSGSNQKISSVKAQPKPAVNLNLANVNKNASNLANIKLKTSTISNKDVFKEKQLSRVTTTVNPNKTLPDKKYVNQNTNNNSGPKRYTDSGREQNVLNSKGINNVSRNNTTTAKAPAGKIDMSKPNGPSYMNNWKGTNTTKNNTVGFGKPNVTPPPNLGTKDERSKAFWGGVSHGLMNVGEYFADFLTVIGTGLSETNIMQQAYDPFVSKIVNKPMSERGKDAEKKIEALEKSAEKDIRVNMADNWYDNKYAKDLRPNIKYGYNYQTGNTIGTIAGYAVEGATGPLSTVLIPMTNGGRTINVALNSGATYDQAKAAGVLTYAKDSIFSLGSGGISTIKNIGPISKAVMASGVQATDVSLDSAIEYGLYAKNMRDKNGNKKYNNILDYYVQSGGLKNAVVSSVGVGLGSLGSSGIEHLSDVKAQNYKNKINTSMNNMDDAQKSKMWQDALEKKYGSEKVGHLQQKVSYVDSSAAQANKQLELDKALKISKWIDITEPKALKWGSKNGKVTVDQDWPPYGGIDPKTVKTFDEALFSENTNAVKIDRIGSMGGGTYAAVPNNRPAYTLTERGIFNNLNSSNPNVSSYRQGSLEVKKYVDFCDGAQDIIDYCNSKGIKYDQGYYDSVIESKVISLTQKLGLDPNDEVNILMVDEAISAGRGSFASDLALKDGSYYTGGTSLSAPAWRDDIVGIEVSLGQKCKYGYIGKAAPWIVSETGEKIATGGAEQLNLRSSEKALRNLGILKEK